MDVAFIIALGFMAFIDAVALRREHERGNCDGYWPLHGLVAWVAGRKKMARRD